MQKQADAQDGVIAKLVPAITRLQESVGIVAAQVEKIETTVTETKKRSTRSTRRRRRSKPRPGRSPRDRPSRARRRTGCRQTTEDVAKKTDEIKKTTDKVAEQNEAIAANQEKQQQTTEKLAAKTDDLSKQTEDRRRQSGKAAGAGRKAAGDDREDRRFDRDHRRPASRSSPQQGGIIADPQRPDEFYHNARLHELSGDMLNARRAYLAFAGFDIDAVDPYLRFATLLRVQDGKAGAREVFGALAEKGKSPALKLVYLLQFDDQQRLDKLNAFIAANPDYGPAYYLLAQEFSEDRLGVQTLADKRAEATALDKFQTYEKDGGLLKYFIDHTLLAEWLEHSRQRLAAIGEVLDPSRFMPKLIPMRSNQDWMFTVSLPEPATGISWRLGKEGPFTETGFLAMNDQTTGKPMPNPSFALPATTPAGTLAIKYLDLRGRETGPFDISFDPQTMLQDGNKQILDQFWTSWIAFDASGNHGLVYFTQMLSYRCAIKEVRYGFNGGSLEKAIDMPPCNDKDPYAIPDNYLPYFKVPTTSPRCRCRSPMPTARSRLSASSSADCARCGRYSRASTMMRSTGS